jgi:hypothetical protein
VAGGKNIQQKDYLEGSFWFRSRKQYALSVSVNCVIYMQI